MPRKRKGRALHGVLLLDKPQGLTSNAALQKVRRAYQAQKAGHTGALDPLATGVLPICLGEATKFSKFLLDADKGYHTTAQLGEIRDSGDSDGELVETREVPVMDAEHVEAALEAFRGDILQVPSMYSALKHQGRPLYEWARKGVTVERPARPVTIHRLTLDAVRPNQLDLSVECSKGTYIRSLVEDLGLALGCGAHVCMLRRFKAGHFRLNGCSTLAEIESQADSGEAGLAKLDARLLSVDQLLPDLPRVCLKSEHSRSILHGQAVRIAGLEMSGLVRIYVNAPELAENSALQQGMGSVLSEEGAAIFAGVARVDDEGIIQPHRMINFADLA